jgi:hypothetical protein
MTDRPARFVSFVASLALLAPCVDGCVDDAHAQSRGGVRRPPPRRDAGARVDASVSRAVDARVLDTGVALRANGCPMRLAGLATQPCSLAPSVHCYDGPERCECTPSAGGARWQCETVFLGPLPPPELAG